jgi:DNA mismatch repair protein MutS
MDQHASALRVREPARRRVEASEPVVETAQPPPTPVSSEGVERKPVAPPLREAKPGEPKASRGDRFPCLSTSDEGAARRPRAADAKTPLLRQYLTLKEAHPDEVLFFRCGDFYEMFYDDAEKVSAALGLVLTTRGPGQENCPMAGIPFHALDRYLPRLIKMGYRVALCEQMEDPKTVQGKRIVEREVVEVLTPGTLTDEKLLDAKEPCWLLAVHRSRRGPVGLSWLDVSTGRFFVTEVARDARALEDELARVRPREVLVAEAAVRALADTETEQAGSSQEPSLETDLGLAQIVRRGAPQAALAPAPDWAFDGAAALRFLCERFSVATLAGFDIADASPSVAAAHALLRYAEEKKPGCLHHIRDIARHRPEHHMAIDAATVACLELVETLRGREREGSLLGVLDSTRTAMGGRLLREWILSPLRDAAAIGARQDAVEAFVSSPTELGRLRETLAQVHDLERLAGRTASGRATPRDLAALRDSLGRLPAVRELVGELTPRPRLLSSAPELLIALGNRLGPLAPLADRLKRVLVPEPALTPADGEIVAPGVDAELDELREIAKDASSHLAKFQAKEVERTGIPSLKVGFNAVFGYYLEVTQAHRDKVPDDYVRKQTLKNCERFLNAELKELEGRILSARERAQALEARILRDLKEEVARAAPELLAQARALAELDALASLAHVARERGHVRPRIALTGAVRILGGRHPVLEANRSGEPFVPNDLVLDDFESKQPDTGSGQLSGDEGGRILVITGPNMAGKSTYIRQSALLVLLAQIGAWVPAESAEVGLCDRIFARVGAADDLARGLSTFMVEMTETANILRHATERSLVVFDEVGRGTSTYDGVSIAWAIVEHLHDHVKCRALFATHYHELVGLAATRPLIANRTCAVRETRSSAGAGDIVFLRKIVPGGADRSYGIHVARLAGVPHAVLERAREILVGLESGSFDALHASPRTKDPRPGSPAQLGLFAPAAESVLAKLRGVDPARTTPLDALLLVHELKKIADGERPR